MGMMPTGEGFCVQWGTQVQFDPEQVDLYFESAAGKLKIIENGVSTGYSEEEATKILSEPAVTAIADIKMGKSSATAWGCDLTYDYVKNKRGLPLIRRTGNMETMENWLQKASVLNEALPYIQRFHGKTIVVKYGGSAMVDHELKKNVIRDVALLKLVGFRPIIVHGGGKEITKWTKKLGIETNFVNGLRVTDKATMEVAEMVLNKVNKGLASMMEKSGCQGCWNQRKGWFHPQSG